MIWAGRESRQAGARLASAEPAATRCDPTATPRRCALTSSTPEALWAARSVQLLNPAAVVARRLRARRGEAVLDGLDLSVPVGARMLVVAEPEATASLLLRVLAGLVRPARGSLLLAGLARGDDSAVGWARRVAYVAAEPNIYRWLSPREALDLTGRLAELDTAERRSRADHWLEYFRFGASANRPMSRGGPAVAQKAALASAMLTEPEVLLLDEPLRSLDPGERSALLRLPGKRRTVLLASRYPASEETLVDRLVLLRGGRVELQAGIEELAEHDLPLSMRGIAALAELRAAAPVAAAESA